MKKILRIALRLAVFGALDVAVVWLFANLQNAGVISPLLAGIFMGTWATYALLACFPSAPIPNR